MEMAPLINQCLLENFLILKVYSLASSLSLSIPHIFIQWHIKCNLIIFLSVSKFFIISFGQKTHTTLEKFRLMYLSVKIFLCPMARREYTGDLKIFAQTYFISWVNSRVIVSYVIFYIS